MKVLFLVSCALAAASASWSHSPVYHGPQHIPVIHKGVPVDTPEVQHAREAHLAALAKASVHSYEHNYDEHSYENSYDNHYDNQYDNHGEHYDNHNNNYGYNIKHVSHPVVYAEHDHHHIAPVYHKLAYSTSYEHPKIGHDGKPLDTPEVESAKAHHFAAVHKALALTASHGVHYRKRRSLYTAYPQHIPIISHKGVPVEPLEVQHARAEHLAAHNIAAHSKSYGYTTHQVHAPVYGHHYDYFIPKYDHEGHPLDTEEVEHAKAAHFAAYHKIGAAVPLVYNYGSYGVPVDTLEVQHAKALHFAAHAAAKAYHY